MKVKFKIFSGFVALGITLAIAAIYSIIEFTKISSSVSTILDDNYQTIEASGKMLELIENIENSVLLLQMGDSVEGRKNINLAKEHFKRQYEIALNNLTEVDEEKPVQIIEENYTQLIELIDNPIAGTDKEGSLKWYHKQFHPLSLKLKASINDLLTLNQVSMHQEALFLKEKSKRAIMPGIISIIASILFTIMFSILINYYYLTPLHRIIDKVKKQKGFFGYKLDEDAIDEIKDLDESLKGLISQMQFRK